MSFDRETLFGLLPGVHRTRDFEVASGLTGLLSAAEQNELGVLEQKPNPTVAEQERREFLRDKARLGPLRALLGVFAGEIAVVEENLGQLYDDLFVETCSDWVLPYIGDLVGYRTLHENTLVDRRAEIAHTIAFRRRKGTLAMLEQLARDVTGWRAHAVEFFLHLGGTQFMNHRRPGHRVTPDLRDGLGLERVGTAFDPLPRTVDVRRIRNRRGRYNLPNIGLFVWRLDAQERGASPATPHPADASGRRFRFHPLGIDAPLCTHPLPDASLAHLTGPLDVPAPISRRAFRGAIPSYYGAVASLAVWTVRAAGPDPFELVPVARIRGCHLGDVPGTGGTQWAHDAATGEVLVDPVLGRLVVGDVPAEGSLFVSFHEAGPDDLGGGHYPRSSGLTTPSPGALVRVPVDFATLQAAIDHAVALQAPVTAAVVEIEDDRRYEEALSITLPASFNFELRAAEGHRPLLVLPSPLEITGGPGASVIVNGVLIAGEAIEVPERRKLADGTDAPNQLDRLTVRHSTLVPGRTLGVDGAATSPGAPSLAVLEPAATLVIERCILGAIVLDEEAIGEVTDSIVDAGDVASLAWQGPGNGADGGHAALSGVTVIGIVRARSLEASNTIFLAPTRIARLQQGCVRFSALPEGSTAPRRYACVPSADVPDAVPDFITLRYGQTGYARLTSSTPAAIRTGADDESEMGAFQYLHEPQRESDLRTRLGEYLRVGLEAGIFHES